MGKTVLITRGMNDDRELRLMLAEHGHRVIHEPLTEIFLNHTARPMLEAAIMNDPDAIIVTSRYGVRALAALSELRDTMLLCVGDSTGSVAESLGFTRVCVAGQTVDDLLDYVIGAYDDGARFLYASAQHVRADLEKWLANYQMSVSRIILYEATASDSLSDTLIEQLKRGHIDASTFLSARSSEIFMKLLDKAGITETIHSMEAFCLSDAVAAPLKSGNWKNIIVANEPTLASLAESVDNAGHDRAD